MIDETKTSVAMQNALLEFISDAAAQDDFLELDEIDQQDNYFTKIYACDSNVVDIFIDPFSRSSSVKSERKIGPGEVFHSDTENKKAAISAAIGQFIWYELSPDQPIFLIPPVDNEIKLLLQIATREVKLPDAVMDQISDLSPVLQSGNPEEAEKAARVIAELIVGVTKRKRLFALRDQKRFLSVDELEQFDIKLPEQVLGILAPMTRVADMIEFSETRDRWQRTLLKLGRRNDIRLERDIDAMGRLEMWNRRLMRLPQPHRMIYITGDNSLLAAGAEMKRFELEDQPANMVFSKNSSFREAFLRHPRCFLDRPYVLRPRSDSGDKLKTTQSIRSWLSLLLGEYQDGQSRIGEWNWDEGKFILADDAVRDIQNISEKNPSLLDELRNAWSEFTDAVELTSLHSGKLLEIEGADRGLQIASLRNFLKEHMPTFEAELKETWEACVRVFTEVRFLFGIVHKQRKPVRRAPRLCLEGVAPQRFLQAAYGWLSDKSSFTTESFEIEKEELERADPGGYNFLVVSAYLLAQGQNWPSAAFLCAHAREVAKHETEGHEKIKLEGANGREAAYLEAFTRRHTARSVSDLDPLLSLIDEAEDLLAKEILAFKEHGRQLDAVPERFLAERLAVEYTRVMLEWHSGTVVEEELIEGLARQYFDFTTQISAEISSPARSDNRALLKSLRQRAYINMCSLALFSGHGFHFRDIGEYAANQLLEEKSDPEADDLSLFGEIILYSGQALFGHSAKRSQNRRHALELIDEALRPDRGDDLGFIYDRRRYQEFRKLLASGLPGS